MKLKVKKLDENAILPTRGSSSAAGWDLYALPGQDVIVECGETKLIRTGLAIEIPEGYFGAIYARSGLATKKGIAPANCVGIIDSDYRGEVMVAAKNGNSPVRLVRVILSNNGPYTTSRTDVASNTEKDWRLEDGERIAQLVIQKYEEIEIDEVDELSDTARGEGGFGSTDN